MEFSQNCVYELKWKPKDDPESSDEELKKEVEKPTQEEISMLRALLADFEKTEEEFLLSLFVEKRDIFRKWALNQAKTLVSDVNKRLEAASEGLSKLLSP